MLAGFQGLIQGLFAGAKISEPVARAIRAIQSQKRLRGAALRCFHLCLAGLKGAYIASRKRGKKIAECSWKSVVACASIAP